MQGRGAASPGRGVPRPRRALPQPSFSEKPPSHAPRHRPVCARRRRFTAHRIHFKQCRRPRRCRNRCGRRCCTHPLSWSGDDRRLRSGGRVGGRPGGISYPAPSPTSLNGRRRRRSPSSENATPRLGHGVFYTRLPLVEGDRILTPRGGVPPRTTSRSCSRPRRRGCVVEVGGRRTAPAQIDVDRGWSGASTAGPS